MTSSAPRLTFAFLAGLLTLLFVTPVAHAQSPGAVPGMGPVAQQERAIWDALQSSNWDTAASYMAPNFVYVADVMGDRAQSIEGMKTCKLSSYTLHDAQTRQLSPDIVLITYVATVDSTCGPQTYKGDVNCSSLWQRSSGDPHGKWMGVLHTEAMAAKH